MYFLESKRIGFAFWQDIGIEKMYELYSNKDVTRYIGHINVEERYHNQIQSEIQYYPMFLKETNIFIGCCGLRQKDDIYELGFHLLPDYWKQGLGYEAASTIINYAFTTLNQSTLFAGHHPENTASKRLLLKLGFEFIKEEFYAPTGLMHPSYILKKK